MFLKHFYGSILVWLSTIIVSVVIIIHVFSGGWRSSIWTNSIQGILLVMGMFILFSTALWYVGVRNSYEYKN